MKPTRTSSTPSRVPSRTQHGSCSGRLPMNEGLLLEGPYNHVLTRDFFSPALDFFRYVTRSGQENSVVLQERAEAIRPAAPSSDSSSSDERFSASCREVVT